MGESKELFELHGLKVMSNMVYTVQHRPDPNAPTGFQKHGATKLPSAGVGETYYCRWIDHGNGRGVWDTGFYTNSPQYTGKTEEEVAPIVKNLMENVVMPYRRSVGNDLAFDAAKDPDIEHTPFNVYDGKIYRTDNPIHVMGLYFALLTRHVVTEQNESDTTFDNASYRIIDIDANVSNRDKEASKEFEAIGEFQKLLYADKKGLFNVLRYDGLNLSDSTEDKTLQGLFKQHLSKGSNIDSFLKLVEAFKTDKGRAKVELYSILKTRALKGTEVTKTPGGIYFYKEIEIGSGLKNAAERISKEKSLNDIKKELLLGDDD